MWCVPHGRALGSLTARTTANWEIDVRAGHPSRRKPCLPATPDRRTNQTRKAGERLGMNYKLTTNLRSCANASPCSLGSLPAVTRRVTPATFSNIRFRPTMRSTGYRRWTKTNCTFCCVSGAGKGSRARNSGRGGTTISTCRNGSSTTRLSTNAPIDLARRLPAHGGALQETNQFAVLRREIERRLPFIICHRRGRAIIQQQFHGFTIAMLGGCM